MLRRPDVCKAYTCNYFSVTERENELNDNDITNLLDNMGADEMKRLEQWFMAKNGLSSNNAPPPPPAPPAAPSAPSEVIRIKLTSLLNKKQHTYKAG